LRGSVEVLLCCYRHVPGGSGRVALGVQGEERRVDIEEGLLLALGQHRVTEHGELHGATDPGVRTDDAGPDVQLLGGDAQRLGQLLEHLGRRAPQAPLDLAQVGVGDAGLLSELTHGQPGRDPLLP
jgi:hypothetical protein